MMKYDLRHPGDGNVAESCSKGKAVRGAFVSVSPKKGDIRLGKLYLLKSKSRSAKKRRANNCQFANDETEKQSVN
ncbi:hypothetical protein JEM67_00550 (plasmid) [Serratia sp. PAMC26656]|uniref:hypothetical protein n=1 Tax=Serratia sp. PAMC26656 TaxID=2775909 RepID=UPI0018F50873|nr:hypothetical protein [Serratia sp. PAMC26656]MBJ7889485.1 hypothetical protein [Serratia sp. PAMC26656]